MSGLQYLVEWEYLVIVLQCLVKWVSVPGMGFSTWLCGLQYLVEWASVPGCVGCSTLLSGLQYLVEWGAVPG